MQSSRRLLTQEEVEQSFADSAWPEILSPGQVANLLGLTSVKTVYEWKARGRLDGTFRKRGKHLRFWRDRVVLAFFNGPDWD